MANQVKVVDQEEEGMAVTTVSRFLIRCNPILPANLTIIIYFLYKSGKTITVVINIHIFVGATTG